MPNWSSAGGCAQSEGAVAFEPGAQIWSAMKALPYCCLLCGVPRICRTSECGSGSALGAMLGCSFHGASAGCDHGRRRHDIMHLAGSQPSSVCVPDNSAFACVARPAAVKQKVASPRAAGGGGGVLRQRSCEARPPVAAPTKGDGANPRHPARLLPIKPALRKCAMTALHMTANDHHPAI